MWWLHSSLLQLCTQNYWKELFFLSSPTDCVTELLISVQISQQPQFQHLWIVMRTRFMTCHVSQICDSIFSISVKEVESWLMTKHTGCAWWEGTSPSHCQPWPIGLSDITQSWEDPFFPVLHHVLKWLTRYENSVTMDWSFSIWATVYVLLDMQCVKVKSVFPLRKSFLISGKFSYGKMVTLTLHATDGTIALMCSTWCVHFQDVQGVHFALTSQYPPASTRSLGT